MTRILRVSFSEHIPAGMSEEQYTEYCLWYLDNHIPSSIAPLCGISARDNIVAHANRLGNIAATIMGEWEKYSIVRKDAGEWRLGYL